MAAVANTQYQRGREAERQRAQEARDRETETQEMLAAEARSVPEPEVTGNLTLIDTIESKLTPTQTPFERLQTAAWQTVSAGELVRGLRGEDLAKVASAHELANRANNTLDRVRAKLSWKLKRLQTLWFDDVARRTSRHERKEPR